MSAPAPEPGALYLAGVAADPKPGSYRTLIEAARGQQLEYSQIWDLFAFQNDFTIHLARFTQGVLRQPTTISPGLRELIAAYTSSLNECAFCTKAHSAAAAELRADEALVWSVRRDLEDSALDDKHKQLLRFVGKITRDLPGVRADDVIELQAAGWDDEAIYFTNTTCALFSFYNHGIAATGVPEMSEPAHREQGRSLATRGYARE